VDTKEPPIIVKSIKNKDKSKLDEYVEIPDVDIEDTIANKTFKKPSSGITKK
tara:strand:+ start:1455 stop:1610 length:156 start_codon:yes stop_codon:yes gene_type:complete